MKKNPKKILIIAALLAALGIGACLPMLAAAIQDRQTLGKTAVTAAEAIRYETNSGLSIPQKLTLLHNSTLEPIENGMRLNAGEAKTQATGELKKLDPDGLLLFDWNSASLEYGQPTFCINAADPSNSVVVWVLDFIDDNGNLLAVNLDDESGKLLGLSLIFGSGAIDSPDHADYFARLPDSGDGLQAELAAYYGLAFSNEPVSGDASDMLETSAADYTEKWYGSITENGWEIFDFRQLSLGSGADVTETTLLVAAETVSFQ